MQCVAKKTSKVHKFIRKKKIKLYANASKKNDDPSDHVQCTKWLKQMNILANTKYAHMYIITFLSQKHT
jgi:hypothetical protein